MTDEIEQMYDKLIDLGIVTEKELSLVTSINGTNVETMESILYSRTGYRSFEQLDEQE